MADPKQNVIEYLSTCESIRKVEVWMQEGVDDTTTPENERKEQRKLENDDLTEAWHRFTGSIGLSDHTPIGVFDRYAADKGMKVCLTIYPGRGIESWDSLTNRHHAYLLSLKHDEVLVRKIMLSEYVFINFEDVHIDDNEMVAETVRKFLQAVIGQIRAHYPGKKIQVYNEGMWFDWHVPADVLPQGVPFGDMANFSGYPHEVAIQKSMIQTSLGKRCSRDFSLCIWPGGYQMRPNYFSRIGRWKDKHVLAWPDSTASDLHYFSLGYFKSMGKMLRSLSEGSLRGLVVHRPNLFSMAHAARLNALFSGFNVL